MSSRKDDPVFNVKFVQLIETKPCLWNSTMPEYSKKDEIQKAWQDVAHESKDTVTNCRERWRTIRSSFLRSLKLTRTNSGRGKRKYYLSKYLQFLIPYTKARLKNNTAIITQRKTSTHNLMTTTSNESQQPMTRISNMPMPIANNDDTKDSINSAEVAAIAEEDVVVSLHEGTVPTTMPSNLGFVQLMPLISPQVFPARLPLITASSTPTAHTNTTNIANVTTIKQEQDVMVGPSGTGTSLMSNYLNSQNNGCPTPMTSDLQRRFICLTAGAGSFATSSGVPGVINLNNPSVNISNVNGNVNGNGNGNGNILNNPAIFSVSNEQLLQHHYQHNNNMITSQTLDLTEFAEWIKCKHETQRPWYIPSTTSAATATGTTPTSTAAAAAAILSHTIQQQQLQQQQPQQNSSSNNNSTNNNNGNHNNSNQNSSTNINTTQQQQQQQHQLQQQQVPPPVIDADQSFLDSLYPFIKEMTGKQNRRFRQKVVALIDAILDDDKDTK